MPINRESIITVLRSTGGNIPDGLTFGEFGFAGANRQLFIGGTGGNQAVQSIWIGASITGEDITTSDGWAGGTGAYRVSTTDAVKRYVDSKFATAGTITAVNGDTGAITITGAGNDAAVVVRKIAGSGNHAIDARIASASLTGVASFDPRHFALGASGHVSLTGTYQVTGDTVVAGNSISVSRSNNQATITNAGVTGITAGTVTYSNLGTNGIFLSGTTGNIQIQNTGVRSLSVLGSGVTADWYQKGPEIQGDGFNINVSAGYGNVPLATSPFLKISSSGLYSLNGLTSGSSVNGPFFTITGDSGAIRAVNDSNTASIIFVPRIASASLTGVASFDPRHFAIGLSGHVSLTGSIGADSVRIASATITGAASFDPRHFAIGASGHVSLTGTYQVTGDTVVAGNSISVVRSNNQTTIANTGVTGIGFGANETGLTGKITLTGAGGVSGSQFITVSGNTVTLDNRIATSSLTGVASFPSPFFTVSLTGAVNLTTAYSVTGDTVVAGNSISVVRTNNQTTIANTGVTGIGFGANDTGLTGKITLTAGAASSQFITVSGNTVTLDSRIASASLTGVASFHPGHFTVTEGRVVASFSGGVTFTGNTVFSSGLSATGITANTIFANNATFTNATFTNDVTVTGNLTVDGTVITANVANIVIEDPLIKLGTGNAGDTLDLGFYGQYVGTNTDKRFTGLFRDANDGGKYKLFTGLTGGSEPTTFVDTSGGGYTVATLIAKLDGGTF